jgi:uncharacterized alkaline shock family protein YloU
MGDNYITCHEEKGSINISEDVISSMVRTAVSEVEGVSALSGTAGSELAELIGLKSAVKGIKVQFDEGKIIVDVIITVTYGYNIVNVAKQVQEKLISVMQSTTGIENAEVNVHISGIAFADAQGAAVGYKVRCLELLTKLLGIQGQADGQVTIVEDI